MRGLVQQKACYGGMQSKASGKGDPRDVRSLHLEQGDTPWEERQGDHSPLVPGIKASCSTDSKSKQKELRFGEPEIEGDLLVNPFSLMFY